MAIKPKADAKRDLNQAAKVVPWAKSVGANSTIKTETPKPVLKPSGSWANRAAVIDRNVREEQEAKKAKNARQNKADQEKKEWTSSLRSSFNRTRR